MTASRLRLRDHHGVPVSWPPPGPTVVVAVPYAFTDVCASELDALDAALPELEAAGVTAYGLSCDAPYSQRAWAEQRGWRLELISDHWPHGALSRELGWFDEDRGCAVRGSLYADRGTLVWNETSADHRDIGGLVRRVLAARVG